MGKITINVATIDIIIALTIIWRMTTFFKSESVLSPFESVCSTTAIESDS